MFSQLVPRFKLMASNVRYVVEHWQQIATSFSRPSAILVRTPYLTCVHGDVSDSGISSRIFAKRAID